MRPAGVMVGAFGEKLRKQREQRGLTLEAISTSTKIGTRMLRAIEDEHFDQLPGGVFNKGFVRAYARQVGLDEEEAVNGYLAAMRDSLGQAPTPNFRVPGDSPERIPELRSIHPAKKNHEVRNQIARVEEASAAPPHLENPAASAHYVEEPGAARATYAGVRNADRHVGDLPNEDGRNEDGRNEDGRMEDRPVEEHRSEDRRSEDRRIEDRRVAERRLTTRRNDDRGVSAQAFAHADDLEEEAFHESAAPMSFLNLESTPPSEIPAHRHARLADQRFPESSPPRIPREAVAAVMVAIIVAVTFLAIHRHRSHAAPLPTQAAQTASTLTDAPLLAPLNSNAKPAGHSEKAKPFASTNAHVTSVVPHDSKSHPEEISDVTTRVVSAPGKKTAATFTLLIRATQTSWISITADGQPIARETLIAPAHTSVRAAHEVVIKAGNAAGISFQLNGMEIPASGNAGEVRTYTFDANGLRSSTAGQTGNATR